MSTNGTFWGMYANGDNNDNCAVAYRAFTNSMPANTVFKIKYKPNGIGNTANKTGGFALRNGTDSSSTNWTTGLRFAFYFKGGDQNSYIYLDANGPTYVNLPFNTAPFLLEFTLLTTDTYRLVVKDASGANILATLDNQPLYGSCSIVSAALASSAASDSGLNEALSVGAGDPAATGVAAVAGGGLWTPYSFSRSASLAGDGSTCMAVSGCRAQRARRTNPAWEAGPCDVTDRLQRGDDLVDRAR
jgi:hypothetical protein